MISLAAYKDYFSRLLPKIDERLQLLPVTVDDQMGKKIQNLPKDSLTLFLLPPAALSKASSVDNYREICTCVLFVFVKYDPMRDSSFSMLEYTQPFVEKLKERLLNDQRCACAPLRIDLSTVETAPETELYSRFAGWSVAFKTR